jgi:hypothetical protein
VPPHEAVKPAHDVWVERESLLGRLLTPHLDASDTCVVREFRELFEGLLRACGR